jgi:hypothetical protein
MTSHLSGIRGMSIRMSRAPRDDFNLTLRLYWPKDHQPSVLDGSWVPRGVTKVSQ